jgi:hypothetical protein
LELPVEPRKSANVSDWQLTRSLRAMDQLTGIEHFDRKVRCGREDDYRCND